MSYSTYTTGGVLAYSGPDGKPFIDEQAAKNDAKVRSRKAEAMGLKARYEVGPGKTASAKG